MRTLYYFFASLLCVLLIAVFFIIKDANTIQGSSQKVELSSEYFLEKLEHVSSFGWNRSLSDKQVAADRPIVNELYINLDLQDVYDLSKKKYYKLDIDKNDSFSMFCVKKALESNNLKYFLIKNKKESQIIVDVQDYSMLHMLVDELGSNQIKSSFTEIWL